MTPSILDRIKWMNETFEIESNDRIVDLGTERVVAFEKNLIKEEKSELLETIETGSVDIVALADCIGDMMIYCMSEARRWGIPIDKVIHCIIDSQSSKLVDGKPIFTSPKKEKFLKGPNYVPPEPKIKALLEEYGLCTN